MIYMRSRGRCRPGAQLLQVPRPPAGVLLEYNAGLRDGLLQDAAGGGRGPPWHVLVGAKTTTWRG